MISTLVVQKRPLAKPSRGARHRLSSLSQCSHLTRWPFGETVGRLCQATLSHWWAAPQSVHCQGCLSPPEKKTKNICHTSSTVTWSFCRKMAPPVSGLQLSSPLRQAHPYHQTWLCSARLLHLLREVLSQRRGTLWHPSPDLWKLHVWCLDRTWRF